MSNGIISIRSDFCVIRSGNSSNLVNFSLLGSSLTATGKEAVTHNCIAKDVYIGAAII